MAVEDGDEGASAPTEHRWRRGQQEPPGTDVGGRRYLCKNYQNNGTDEVS